MYHKPFGGRVPPGPAGGAHRREKEFPNQKCFLIPGPPKVFVCHCCLMVLPLAALLNQSFAEGVVPRQCKTALIVPVSKVAVPASESDYRTRA